MNRSRQGTLTGWAGTIGLIAVGVVLLVPTGGGLGLPTSGVSAAPTPVAHQYTLGTNTSSAGYVGRVTSGNLSRISGDWNVASATCQPNLEVAQRQMAYLTLQGTGGAVSVVEQATCVSTLAVPSYEAYAQFPTGAVLMGHPAAGDLLSVAMTTTSTAHCGLVIRVRMSDLSTGNTLHTHQCIPGFSPTLAAWEVSNYFGGALAEFAHPVRFHSGTVNNSGTDLTIAQVPGLEEVVMVDSGGQVLAQPTPLTASGSAFSVAWVASVVGEYHVEGSTGGVAEYIGSVGSGNLSKVSAVWSSPVLTCQPSLATAQRILTYLSLQGGGETAYAFEEAVCAQGGLTPSYFFIAQFPDSSMQESFVGDLGGVNVRTSISTHPSAGCGGLAVHIAFENLSNGQHFRAHHCAAGFSPVMATWTVGVTGSTLAEFGHPVRFRHCFVVQSGTKLTVLQLSALPYEIVMVDSSGYVMAESTTLAASGSAFSVRWVSST